MGFMKGQEGRGQGVHEGMGLGVHGGLGLAGLAIHGGLGLGVHGGVLREKDREYLGSPQEN